MSWEQVGELVIGILSAVAAYFAGHRRGTASGRKLR